MLAKGNETSALQSLDCPDTLAHYIRGLLEGQVRDDARETALMTLREWGVPQVKVLSLIAAREGVDAVSSQFPEAQIYVCQIDPILNDRKYIVPGLGYAGDRIFNT